MTKGTTIGGFSRTPKAYQQYINGVWVPAASGKTFESLNPFDDSVFAIVPDSGCADVTAAVEAAAAAQPGWAALPPSAKQALFLRAAKLVEERSADIREALGAETGAGIGIQFAQIGWNAGLLRQGASWVYQPKGNMIRSEFPTTRAYTERKPLGVVGSFGPWNVAQFLSWRSVVAPLAAGNTVVLKPSEESPVTSGIQVAEILDAAAFPPGVVNVVTHAGPSAVEIVNEFYENPKVRKLYFTGSAPTGSHVAAKAAAALKPIVLELGGYNHMLILEDADVDYAVRLAVFSSFFHQGQICMCARKILVHDDIYDNFLSKFIELTNSLGAGDPFDPNTIVGPLINDKALANAQRRIADAVAAGSVIAAGGKADGRVLSPTILTNVPDTVEVAHEETFAPIVVVERVADTESAIAAVNASNYGLSFSVITEDISRGEAVARRIESGAVHVNAPTIEDEAHAPNGGVKDSGWGRSGVEGLDDFTELRWMTVEDGRRDLPI